MCTPVRQQHISTVSYRFLNTATGINRTPVQLYTLLVGTRSTPYRPPVARVATYKYLGTLHVAVLLDLVLATAVVHVL